MNERIGKLQARIIKTLGEPPLKWKFSNEIRIGSDLRVDQFRTIKRLVKRGIIKRKREGKTRNYLYNLTPKGFSLLKKIKQFEDKYGKEYRRY